MKRKNKLFASILSIACMSAGVISLASCSEKDVQDTRDPQILAVYTAYAQSTENPLTYEEWLAELLASAKGEKGDTGPQGEKGETGPQGEKGETGPQGEDGKSAYEIYLEYLPEGATPLTEEEWLASLKGENGASGADGKDGKDGQDGANGTDGEDGKSAYEIYLEYLPEGATP